MNVCTMLAAFPHAPDPPTRSLACVVRSLARSAERHPLLSTDVGGDDRGL